MLKQIRIDRTFIILAVLIVVLIGFIIGFRQNIYDLFTGNKSQAVSTEKAGSKKSPNQLAVSKDGLLAKALQSATGQGTLVPGSPTTAGTNPNDPLATSNGAQSGTGNLNGNGIQNGLQDALNGLLNGQVDPNAQTNDTAQAGANNSVTDIKTLRNPFQNFFKKVIPFGQNPNQGYVYPTGNSGSLPPVNSNITYQNPAGQQNTASNWNYPTKNQNPVSNSNNNQNSNTNHNTNSSPNQNGSTQASSGKLPEPVLVKPEIIYPPFELKGIVTFDSQERALIVIKNQSQIVNKGDILQNWSIADIDKDKVILTNQEGQRFILTLEGVTLDDSKSEGKTDGKK